MVKKKKKSEILLYSVSFCPLKSKFNLFLRIQFSHRLSRGIPCEQLLSPTQEKPTACRVQTKFVVFLQVIHIKLSSYC